MMRAKRNNKDGGILALAVIVVLWFSVLTIGLYKLFGTDSREAVYVEHHRRAFWAAETGLETFFDMVRVNHKTLPTAPFPVNLGQNIAYGGIANCTIESYSFVPLLDGERRYTVVSRGVVGEAIKRIRMTFLTTPGSTPLIRSTQGNMSLLSNVGLDGGVMIDEGSLQIAANSFIDGFTMVEDAITGNANSVSDLNIVEAAFPPPPSVDIGYWNSFLNSVSNNAYTGEVTNSFINVTSANGVSNFLYSGGGTLEIDSKPVITGNAAGSNNFHYIVSNTDIDFTQHTIISNNTAIVVNGSIDVGQQIDFGTNVTIFATGNIILRQASTSGSSGALVIALGNVDILSNSKFNGFILSSGSVSLEKNQSFSGSIQATGDISVGQNTSLEYNPDVFQQPMIGVNGLGPDALNIRLKKLTWTEL